MRKYVSHCATCTKRKASNLPARLPLVPLPLPLRYVDRPFACIAIDIVGPINPPSSSGHRWILTIHDLFSKLLVAYPLRSTTAATIVNCLDRYISDFEIPDVLVSDRGTNVDSALVHSWCRTFGIQKRTASARNPTGNSAIERSHRVMSDIIATITEGNNPRMWHEALPRALRAYKTSQHESTGVSAHELVFGYPAKSPLSLLAGPNAEPLDAPSGSPVAQAAAKRDRLARLWQHASAGLDKATEHRRRKDSSARQQKFSVGDTVAIVVDEPSGKFADRYRGPFIVRAVSDSLNDYLVSPPGQPDETLPWLSLRKLVPHPPVEDTVHPQPSAAPQAHPPLDVSYDSASVDLAPRRRPFAAGEGEDLESRTLRPTNALRQPRRLGINLIRLATGLLLHAAAQL